MTEEQKKFKILKRTSYEEQISEADKEVVRNVFSLGLAIFTLCYSFRLSVNSRTVSDAAFAMLYSTVGTFTMVRYLVQLIKVIREIVVLQGKIKAIDNELEIDSNMGIMDEMHQEEENRSKRR